MVIAKMVVNQFLVKGWPYISIILNDFILCLFVKM